MLEKYVTFCEHCYTMYLKHPKKMNSELKLLFTIWKHLCWKAVVLERIAFMVLNPMSRISQHDAAANKTSVPQTPIRTLQIFISLGEHD